MSKKLAGGCGVAGIGALSLYVGVVAAWATAVAHTIKTEQYIWLLVDVIIPPVGVVHGICIWLT